VEFVDNELTLAPAIEMCDWNKVNISMIFQKKIASKIVLSDFDRTKDK